MTTCAVFAPARVNLIGEHTDYSGRARTSGRCRPRHDRGRLAHRGGNTPALATRMTGGGFGGSIVALVEADRAPSLVAAVTTGYAASVDREATGYIRASVNGAGDVEPESAEI